MRLWGRVARGLLLVMAAAFTAAAVAMPETRREAVLAAVIAAASGRSEGEYAMRASIIALALILMIGSWSAQPSWGADPRRSAPGPVSAPALPPSVRQPRAVAIKQFAIWTPVVGSNKTVGRVQLTAPAGDPPA
jgi:hypothetical protein